MATSEVQQTRDDKQITFDLDSKSVLYWRRVLLLRYYCELGKNSEVVVSWLDYNKVNEEIKLNDEDAPFVERKPDPTLYKTMVKITHQSTKIITITLFYTTKRCLVQGNSCQNWVEREFDKIKRCVDMCLKGGNPKQSIDNLVRKMNNVLLPSLADNETVLNNSQTIPKNIDDSFDTTLDSSQTIAKSIDNSFDSPESLLSVNTETKKCVKKPVNTTITTKQDEPPTKSKITETDNKTDFNQQLTAALHSLENKLIECHSEYTAKIDTLNDVIKKWEERYCDLEKSKQQVERKMENDLSNIYIRLEQIESKIQDKANTNTVKSHAEQIAKLESVVCEKLEVIQEKCEEVINTRKKEEGSDNKGIDVTQSQNQKLSENKISQEKVEKDNNFPLNHEEHHIPSNQIGGSNNTQLWIVGTSVVKDLKKSLMYRSQNVTITTLKDKTVRGAQEFLNSGKLSADNILYQVGSNDLEMKDPSEVVEEIERLIINTKELLPQCRIIISQILPRFLRNQNFTNKYEEKRLKCNQFLNDLCNQYGLQYVKHENLHKMHFNDGIHLSRNGGIGSYVRNLKETMNPILGIKQDERNKSGNHTNRGNYDQHARRNFGYNQVQGAGYGYNNMNRGKNNNSFNVRNGDINMRLLRIALGL